MAAAGFAALLVDFYFRQETGLLETREAAFARRRRLDENQTLRDLSAAVDWLKQRTGLVDGRIGTVGFCMGGTFVLDLAAMRSDVATVAYYAFPAGSGRALGGVT